MTSNKEGRRIHGKEGTKFEIVWDRIGSKVFDSDSISYSYNALSLISPDVI